MTDTPRTHYIGDRERGGVCRSCGQTIGMWGAWTGHAELADCGPRPAR